MPLWRTKREPERAPGYNYRMFSNIRLTLFCYLSLAGITKG